MAARPTTRRPPAPPQPPAPARPPVRDFTGGTGVEIAWDVRPAYDFIFSLAEDAGSTEDLAAADRRWLTDARASLPRAVRASVGRLFHSDICINIAGFIVDRAEIRTSDAFVAALRAATPGEAILALFSEALREPDLRPLVEAAAAGDRSAAAEIQARRPDWHAKEKFAVLEDPVATYADLVEALSAWQERFVEVEARVGAMLERDHDFRAPDRATLRGSDLIERMTGGIRWLGEPGVRRVLLAPSYFSRPYNFILAGADWRLFGYPIADEVIEGADPLAPPPSVVRLHRALGDATRLRILKLLADRDLYLTEIAQQLELSKPTIKHHLALLRAAGLVTVTESGTVMYYSLRREQVEQATRELTSFLVG